MKNLLMINYLYEMKPNNTYVQKVFLVSWFLEIVNRFIV